MQIARMARPGPDGPLPRVVVAADDDPNRWIDLRAALTIDLVRRGAGPEVALRVAAATIPGSLTAVLDGGPLFFDAARAAIANPPPDALVDGDWKLLCPVDPPAYRDFMAFEQHFRAGSELSGTAVPDVLYEMPVSYMGSVQGMMGPEDIIPWPAYSQAIDFELEIGIVIGRSGRNLTPDRALEHVLGLTVFNDFSARDIQFREMTGRLGPSKGKHFASSAGPRIVTLDAINANALVMLARVNGEEWTRASSATILWTLAEIVAWASTGENLAAGTLIGTGTVGGGCGVELDRLLAVGDEVELEIEGIGVLRNRIGADPASSWWPTARLPAPAGPQ
jgi:2-keto-4-pentenoate hydratase/2-oxohepta-3-ene-1,7-dioic acid hydratase in catechol pathway